MVRGKILTLAVLVLAVLAVVGTGAAQAEILRVPEQFDSIEAALAQAKSGDRVLIQPGVYAEYGLDLPAGVVLAGATEEPGDTVIEAAGRGRILRMTEAVTPSLVTNLTFRSGWARGETSYEQSGGAIYLNGARLEVSNCRFEGNVAVTHGGAIRAMGSVLTVRDCLFLDNRALVGGGGALDCSYEANVTVESSEFNSNLAAWGGAIASRGLSDTAVLASSFFSNRSDGDLAYGGGAVSFFDSEPQYRFCTFYDNESTWGGAIAALPDAPAAIEHCTITQNRAETGGGFFNRDASSRIEASILVFQDGTGATSEGNRVVQVSCTNVHGNSGGDLEGLVADEADKNISADPMFCDQDETGLTFSVDIESPCVTESACATMGAWMAGCAGTRGIQTIAPTPRVLSIEGVHAAPNPFNPSTRVRFELKSKQRVRAEVYSIDGRRVRLLADQEFTEGWNTLPWNGLDDTGRSVGSGAYVVRLQGEAVTRTQKVLLLK